MANGYAKFSGLGGSSGGGGGVTSVTASGPLASSGGATPNISITQSSTSTDGYLSSVDWNTFNGKQAAGNYALTNLSNLVTTPTALTIATSTTAGVTSSQNFTLASGNAASGATGAVSLKSGNSATGNSGNVTVGAGTAGGGTQGTLTLIGRQILINTQTSLSMNSRAIVSLLDPTNPQDAATKNYVDTAIAAVNASVTGSFTGGTQGNAIIYPTVTYDSNSAYNNTTGVFTVPSSGIYLITAYFDCTASQVFGIYVNNTLRTTFGNNNAAGLGTGSSPVSVSTSDTIYVGSITGAVTSSGSDNNATFTKVH